MSVDLNDYTNFVNKVTSDDSKFLESFIARLKYLEENNDLNMSLLLTSSVGMSSESGEFSEIVKKMSFQGKEFDEEVRFHLKRELGDIIFYWMDACIALKLNPYSVINENINKLEKRYPGGFSVDKSENRERGDI